MTAAAAGGRTIMAVAPGGPLAASTWSGTSASLFGEIDRRGLLGSCVDASLPRVADTLVRAAAVHPDLAVWRERSNLGRARARAMGSRASRAAAASRDAAVLQIGSWCMPPRVDGARRAVYLDSEFAQLLDRDDAGAALRRGSSFATWRMEFERSVYEDVDVVLTMSEWTRASVVADFGIPDSKVVVARPGPNSVAPAAPDSSEEAVREPGPPRFLFVGKKWARKGGPLLLDAFAVARRALGDAELWVVGPEQAPSTAPGVRHVGRLDRRVPEQARLLEQLFSRADAFVLPSTYEPFGIAFVEAMHRGLPVVAARACAMPEIVVDGETGLLVDPGASVQLSDALIELGRSPERAARMGRAGQARAVAQYTWSRCVDTVVDALGLSATSAVRASNGEALS